MEHTKCRICGNRHPLGGCPEFKKNTPDLLTMIKKGLKKPRKIKLLLTPEEKVAVNNVVPKPPKYDRNEAHRNYMREYARRKRAERKAK